MSYLLRLNIKKNLLKYPLIDPKVSRVMGLIKRSGRNLSFDSQQLYDLLKQRYLKN